jgi:hypothetical protein
MDGKRKRLRAASRNIGPMIETVSLDKAAHGYAQMMEGKARFSMVLVANNGFAQSNQKYGMTGQVMALYITKSRNEENEDEYVTGTKEN